MTPERATNAPTASWSVLLQRAIRVPGFQYEAYHQFHAYGLRARSRSSFDASRKRALPARLRAREHRELSRAAIPPQRHSSTDGGMASRFASLIDALG